MAAYHRVDQLWAQCLEMSTGKLLPLPFLHEVLVRKLKSKLLESE